MSWWSRMWGREERSATSDSFARATGIWSADPPTHVSQAAAENLATVLACVNAIASALASLPLYVYRTASDGGRTEAPAHPVAQLLRRPHPRLSEPDLREWWVAQTLLHGNGVLEQVRDGAGRVVALEPVPWPSVAVMRTPSGRLRYDFNRDGVQHRLIEDDAVVLRDRSDDGIVGRSRLSRAGAVVRNAEALQIWSEMQWRNGARPSGVVELPGMMGDEAFERFKTDLQQNFVGQPNAGKTLILEGGGKFNPVTNSPEAAEMLASRRFGGEEICRIFNVPPPIVQDYTHNTFTNSTQASLWFASNTLAPWCRKIEAALSAALFGADDVGMSVELDLSGLMRGDYAARWAANVAAVQAGILTVDEVRQAEGWNPRPNPPQAPAQGDGNA